MEAVLSESEWSWRAQRLAAQLHDGLELFDQAADRFAARDHLLLLADADGVAVRTAGGGRFANDAKQARLKATISRASRLAKSRIPLLILAETGCGKELLAKSVHRASTRRDGPFIAVNCGAISDALLEAELFGYAPGAFTGASASGREGRLATADGGTLFLDELCDMPPGLQVALLRFLEDGTYHRVGDPTERRADVRIVAATGGDLLAQVQRGEFRSDLYYRICGATLTLPPLRDRTDRVELARHLLTAQSKEMGFEGTPELGPEAASWVGEQPWPGNVRQLKSALSTACVLAAPRLRLERADFGVELATEPEVHPRTEPTLADSERTTLERALTQAQGNISAAARRLGVARSTVYRMMRRHGISENE